MDSGPSRRKGGTELMPRYERRDETAEWERQKEHPARDAERNQRHVRDLLADRDPQYARTLERTVRDLSPRTGRSSR
jgi:hypothetical protein